MRIIITEEQKKKLFIPRKLSGSDSRWVKWNNEQPIKDGKRINQYTEDGKKIGYWEEYYSNGNLDSKGSYINGLEEGYWEFYHLNGSLRCRGSYVNGKADGYWEDYHINGQLMYKGSYINGKEEGIWERYWSDGTPKDKILYQNGKSIKKLTESEEPKKGKLFIPRKLSGEDSRWTIWNKKQPIKDGKRINQYDIDGFKTGYWEHYYTNGSQLMSKGSYENGEKNGIWEDYFPNGELWLKGFYKNGEYIKKLTESEEPKKGKLFIPRKLTGSDSRYVQWNNDQPIIDGVRINQYTEDGKKTGIWEKYYKNGQLWIKGSYKNGKQDGVWENYHDNGQLGIKGFFKNGKYIKQIKESEQPKKGKLFIPRKLSGEGSRWVIWNNEQPIKDGVRINQYDIETGEKDGYWETYDRDGNLESKGNYVNGKADGYFESYDEDGKLYEKGHYKNGEMVGYWETYDYTENVYNKGHYKNNLMDGLWKYYYPNGQLYGKGYYKNDFKDGVWEWYDKNGKLTIKDLYKNGGFFKELPLKESEESKKGKLFVPRKISGEDSRWTIWNNEQPIKDGKPINQYTEDGKKIGYWEQYHTNGKIHRKGFYVNGEPDGIWEEYNFDGNLWRKGSYENGKKEGIWEYYQSNGNLDSKGSYKNGKHDGLWEMYGFNGKIIYKELFKNGKSIKKIRESEQTPTAIINEEISLLFEGNIQDYLKNIINKVTNLPYEAKKKYLTLVITSLLGYTSYPIIQSIIDKSADKETKEIVKSIKNDVNSKKVSKKKVDNPNFKDGSTFRLSRNGFNHIVNEEQPKLVAYSLGDGKITVGYGHAEPIETTELKVGQEITHEEAKAYFKQDLKYAADGVRNMFKEFKKQGKNYKITQDMFDALVSMAYNMGVTGLKNTKMIQHIKNSEYRIAGELIKQTKINPDKFPGLTKRREKESQMFLSYQKDVNV